LGLNPRRKNPTEFNRGATQKFLSVLIVLVILSLADLEFARKIARLNLELACASLQAEQKAAWLVRGDCFCRSKRRENPCAGTDVKIPVLEVRNVFGM
jgi:hypothetical protein